MISTLSLQPNLSVFPSSVAEESRMGYLENKPYLASRGGNCTVPVFLMQSGNYFQTGPQIWWLQIDSSSHIPSEKAIQLPTWFQLTILVQRVFFLLSFTAFEGLKSTKQDLTVINTSLKNMVPATKLGKILPLNSGGNSQTGCEHAMRTQNQDIVVLRPQTI